MRDGTVRLRAEASGAGIRVIVSDRGRWRPPRHLPYRGNGIKLIRATMRDVNIMAGDAGTTVEMRAGLS